MKHRLMVAVATLAAATSVHAGPFTHIRIGDIDGFGYGAGSGFAAANGSAVDQNGDGVLWVGDFLPDVDGNGTVATRILSDPPQNDDFDNRTLGGADAGVTCEGCVVGNTTGSEWTDVSLSTSYDMSQSEGAVWNDNTGTLGIGGAFPDPLGSDEPNEPSFRLDFSVAMGDIDPTADVFFNLLFGDYDVDPMQITLTNAFGTNLIFDLSTQPGAEDGLIQAAFAPLAFSYVFAPMGTHWVGVIDVTVRAPSEPYTAFDFVELSTTPIGADPPSPSPAPEPATATIVGLGLLGLWAAKRHRLR